MITNSESEKMMAAHSPTSRMKKAPTVPPKASSSC